jgi:hypothetical protein
LNPANTQKEVNMPEPKLFIVGRTTEIENFSALLNGRTRYGMLNIYGPGGIGKTIVGLKMQEFASNGKIPLAFIDGNRPDLTPDRILYTIKEGFATHPALSSAFGEFEREYADYLVVQEVLQRGGSIQTLFDAIGNVKDPIGFGQIIQALGKGITEGVQRNISNRFALERYLRGVEKTLVSRLAENVHIVLEKKNQIAAVIFDTYEEMEGFDDWMCQMLVPALPDKVKIVILGRNALPKINFDWSEFNEKLFDLELEELPEADAKAYLVHFGLRNDAALEQVYRFTGGYPMLLVLVRYLAHEVGGWDKIGELDNLANRDQIATQLLQRILREERVAEVQAFLEKGVVARWFNPEVIGVLLEVSLEDARKIYDKLSRHSFVERHEYGLKFHDKIRELLLERLKFTSQLEYEKLTQRLTNYYREKAGLEADEQEA